MKYHGENFMIVGLHEKLVVATLNSVVVVAFIAFGSVIKGIFVGQVFVNLTGVEENSAWDDTLFQIMSDLEVVL